MELRKNPEWTVWWRPARDPVTGQPLWPNRWNEEALSRREREIGPRPFAQQFLLQPMSSEDRTFPQEAIQACRSENLIPGQVEVPDSWPRYAGVDLASSLGQKAAWTVMFTIAVDPENKRRYPLEIIRKRQQFPDTVRMIEESYGRFRQQLIFVESNAFQQVGVQQLSENNRSIPVKDYHTGHEKVDPQVGIPSLAAGMANAAWVIPCGGPAHQARCGCGWCAWIRELSLHPGGEYSDTLVAMWLAELAVRQGESRYWWEDRKTLRWFAKQQGGRFEDDPNE